MADIVSFDEVVGSHDAHARFYCEDDAVVSYDIVSCCGVVRGPGFEENSVESDIVDIVARDLITHASNPNTRTIDPVVDSLRYFEPSDSNVICGEGEAFRDHAALRSEEHTSELQSQSNLVCRLLLEKKNRAH